MTIEISREQVVRYRARASHLDRKLPPGAFAEAAWGGLQDSVPRGGVMSLHARVENTQPGSWEDSSLVQIWFRGGADYIVPRRDVGVFTLGALPRDPEAAGRLEAIADAVLRVTDGRTLSVREVADGVAEADRAAIKTVSPTGRVHIRWDASNIWIIPAQRPEIDPEEARLELARRFVHWFGPTTRPLFARWAGLATADARTTWQRIEDELVEVRVGPENRFVLESDLGSLRNAAAVTGVRLIPFDDAFTKLDRDLLVEDEELRRRVIPPAGTSLGYIPGAILVDGEIVGAWARRQRKVTIHPESKLNAAIRDEIEREALTFPIAGSSKATVDWA